MVFQEYQDPKVGKYLKYGYWYAAHKERLYRILVSALLAIVALVWFNLLYRTYAYMQGRQAHQAVLRALVRPLVDAEALRNARAPQAVRITKVAVMAGAQENTADFAVFLENPNPNWYVELEYSFAWPGGSTVSQSTFLLPGQARPAVTRGATINGLPANVEAEVTAIVWRRIRGQEELAAIVDTASGIVVSGARADSFGDATSAEYSVRNGSRYDILDAEFLVVLSRLGEPIALGVNSVDEFESGAEKELAYRWLVGLGSGLSVDVYPVVNLYDTATRRLPEGNQVGL
ncbi:MAG: hypothetical protein HY462_01510 [Parcubacteria group bacterium]|nr:hypothetical protein [Parcubacteria group bacterium]